MADGVLARASVVIRGEKSHLDKMLAEIKATLPKRLAAIGSAVQIKIDTSGLRAVKRATLSAERETARAAARMSEHHAKSAARMKTVHLKASAQIRKAQADVKWAGINAAVKVEAAQIKAASRIRAAGVRAAAAIRKAQQSAKAAGVQAAARVQAAHARAAGRINVAHAKAAQRIRSAYAAAVASAIKDAAKLQSAYITAAARIQAAQTRAAQVVANASSSVMMQQLRNATKMRTQQIRAAAAIQAAHIKAQAGIGRATQQAGSRFSQSTRRMSSAMSQLGQHIANVASKIRTSFSGITAGSNAASGSLGKMMQIAGGVAGGIGIAKLFSSATSAAKGFFAEMIQGNGVLEKFRVTFAHLMNDNDAKALMDQLRALSFDTPFEEDSLFKGAQDLMAAGFNPKKIVGMMEQIGNAAASSSLGMDDAVGRISYALRQMKQLGRISGQDLLQLSSSSIPALAIIQEQFGKTYEEVQADVKAGLTSIDEVVNAILGGLDKRFGGLMRKQAKTLPGLWSSFLERGRAAIREIGEPFYALAKIKLDNLVEWMKTGSFRLAVQQLQKIAQKIAIVVNTIYSAGVDLFQRFFSVQNMEDMIYRIQQVVAAVKNAMSDSGVASGLITDMMKLGVQLVGYISGELFRMGMKIGQGLFMGLKSALTDAITFVSSNAKDLMTILSTQVDMKIAALRGWHSGDGESLKKAQQWIIDQAELNIANRNRESGMSLEGSVKGFIDQFQAGMQMVDERLGKTSRDGLDSAFAEMKKRIAAAAGSIPRLQPPPLAKPGDIQSDKSRASGNFTPPTDTEKQGFQFVGVESFAQSIQEKLNPSEQTKIAQKHLVVAEKQQRSLEQIKKDNRELARNISAQRAAYL